ncbi:putative serine/threonine protein phosphatase [Perkinsus chesapeaki]|uniref:Putative serine/threonine protein phosphatase n=1 Tax=Perkinsus chesapeaki TaxID=330153 RepID=A0A7J6MSG3_PERCH|nr:putative serine/threonine protein phosphatase [Perkinsus chesapeaki]
MPHSSGHHYLHGRRIEGSTVPAVHLHRDGAPAPIINLPQPDDNILCTPFCVMSRVECILSQFIGSRDDDDLCGSMEYSSREFEDRWLYGSNNRMSEENRQQALAQRRMMDLLTDRGYENISPLPDDVQGGEAWVVYCSKSGSDYVAKMKPIDKNVLIEAETLSRLQSSVTHPYIVQLCDFILTDCLLCLLFEAVHPVGMDLVEVLALERYHGAVDHLRMRKWMLQLCLALEYSHAHSVWHRDIKAENVMIDSNDNARLLDFGMAAFARTSASGLDESSDLDGEERNKFFGTEQYAAPEVILHQEYTAKVDLWGLGVILHQVYQGRAPLMDYSDTPGRLRIKGPLRPMNPWVMEAMLGLLEPDPERRWGFDQIYACRWMQESDDFSMDAPVGETRALSGRELIERISLQPGEPPVWVSLKGVATCYSWDPHGIPRDKAGAFLRSHESRQLRTELSSVQVARGRETGNIAVDVSDMVNVGSIGKVFMSVNGGLGVCTVMPSSIVSDRSSAHHFDHSSIDLAALAGHGFDVSSPPPSLSSPPSFHNSHLTVSTHTATIVPGRSLEQRLSSLSARGARPGHNEGNIEIGGRRSRVPPAPRDHTPLPPSMMTFLSVDREVLVRSVKGRVKVWISLARHVEYIWRAVDRTEVSEVISKLQPLLHRMRALRASYPGLPAFAVEVTDLVRKYGSDKLFVTVNGGIGRVFSLAAKGARNSSRMAQF